MTYKDHELYMKKALHQAMLAFDAGEIPVGCVIVKNGEIISEAHNRCECAKNPLGHAECEAIRLACKKLNEKRLGECDLYVTLEPCAMCTGAIINAGVRSVFFGARDNELGACGGRLSLFDEGFGSCGYMLGGILEKECGKLIEEFFIRLRAKEK